MQASLTDPNGQRTELTSTVVTIGRAPDNQLVLQDQQASSHHAEIRPDPQGYLLVDINSRNGTFVNEQRLMPQTPRLLIPGDVIRIGETRLTYGSSSGDDDATVRAGSAEYGNPSYSPTVAVPPPVQSDFASYQQQAPSPYSDYQQPAPPAYSNYQQPAPSAPNYPQADQPGYNSAPPAYSTPSYSQYPQQAPWAGTPGQFIAPSPVAVERAKKRRTGLIIGLIVLLLVIVGGAIAVFAYVNRSTPDKTLQAFCTALKNNDEHGAYSQFGTNITSQETEQQYAPKFSTFENALNSSAAGGLKDCTVSNVQQNGSTATGTITLSVNKSTQTLPVNYTLSNENGTWKLENATLPTQTGQ